MPFYPEYTERLEWKYVNLEGRQVVLTETKSSEPRMVPLGPKALAILCKQPRSIDQGSVFGLSEVPTTRAANKTPTADSL